MLTTHAILLIVAFVMFLLAAFPRPAPPVQWQWLGAAFVVLAWLV